MVCIFCGSNQHNYRNCPVASKIKAKSLKQEFQGEAPNIFVGHYGYPFVNVGLLSAENYEDNDNPLLWSREERPIDEIISLRSSLINARKSNHVRSFNKRLIETAQEVGLATTPVDLDISLEKKPKVTSWDSQAMPHGPSAPVKKASIISNPKTNPLVEKAYYDTDLKADHALVELYAKGVDEHQLTKAFSVGNFGIGKNRKMVPTRWSITAVDDTLGKNIINDIKEYSESDSLLFFGGHYGNYYAILFFDDLWQYELYEQFIDSEDIVVEHDYESYFGRKDYAHETQGGYYASRLAVLEKLKEIKRQSAVLVIRIITKEYTAPLGVWVVREAVRKTLRTKPITFGSRDLMTKYAKNLIRNKFGYDISPLFKRSELIKALNRQKKIKDYL